MNDGVIRAGLPNSAGEVADADVPHCRAVSEVATLDATQHADASSGKRGRRRGIGTSDHPRRKGGDGCPGH